MPVVPYRNRVQQAPIPDVRKTPQAIPRLETPRLNLRATPEQFGSELGGTIANVGQAFYTQGMREREQKREEESLRADKARMAQEKRAAQDWELAAIHDPKTGALSQKGQNAINLGQSVKESFKKFTDERRGGLANDRQREAYDAFVSEQEGRILLPVMRHESAQVQAFHVGELEGEIKNSQALAGLNAGDPDRVLAERRDVARASDELATIQGLGPKEKEAFIATNVSSFHKQVIDQLAIDSDQEAQRYFVAVGDEVIGADRLAIERTLKTSSTRGGAQRNADRIAKTLPEATLTEWMDEAAKIENPEVRQDTEERLKSAHSIRRQQESDERQIRNEQAAESIKAADLARRQMMIELGNLIDVKKGTDAIPPAVWDTLTIQEKNAFDNYADSLRESVSGTIKTNQAFWYSLMQEASDNPEKFVKRDLNLDRAKLSDSDFQEIAKLQRSVREGKKKDVDTVLDGFRTNQQILDDALALAGVDKSDDPKSTAQLRQMVDEQVQTLQRTTGKKATNADVQEIVDGLMMKATTQKGSLLGILPGIPYYDVEKPLFQIGIADISATERKQIEDALRSSGLPITDAAILNLYRTTKQRLQKK